MMLNQRMHDPVKHQFDCDATKVISKMGNSPKQKYEFRSTGLYLNSMIPMISMVVASLWLTDPVINWMIDPIPLRKRKQRVTTIYIFTDETTELTLS